MSLIGAALDRWRQMKHSIINWFGMVSWCTLGVWRLEIFAYVDILCVIDAGGGDWPLCHGPYLWRQKYFVNVVSAVKLPKNTQLNVVFMCLFILWYHYYAIFTRHIVYKPQKKTSNIAFGKWYYGILKY